MACGRRNGGQRNGRGGLAAWAVAFVFSLLFNGAAWAWGEEGHSIVAEIAQRRLNDKAAAKVAVILGKGVSLASVSTWADDVRSARPETYNWHFVDIPLADKHYDPARDCRPSKRGDCVVAALARLGAILRDPSATPSQKRESLRYIVHFVADVHQPLHTVLEDQGGNQIPVTLYTDPRKRQKLTTNLHAAWDAGLIRAYYYSWGSYVDFLEGNWLPAHDEAALAAGSVEDWVLEAHADAVRVAYVPARGPAAVTDLDDAYLQAARQVIDRALGAGGVRLARLLNEALGK
jgi:hypothetical protein